MRQELAQEHAVVDDTEELQHEGRGGRRAHQPVDRREALEAARADHAWHHTAHEWDHADAGDEDDRVEDAARLGRRDEPVAVRAVARDEDLEKHGERVNKLEVVGLAVEGGADL